MAKRKKSDVNKAAEIRSYFAAHPDAKGVEVVEALGKRGITISPAQVSNVKNSSGGKKKRRKTGGVAPTSAGLIKAAEEIGSQSLAVIEAGFTMLELLTVDAAKNILDRLSGGKRKAK